MKQWLTNLWRGKIAVPHRLVDDHFENVISGTEWYKLLSFARSLGLSKQPDHWGVHDIQKGYYYEHSFYYSFKCNAPLHIADKIEEYMSKMPRLSEEASRWSEEQSDRCLSAGATMGTFRSDYNRRYRG